MCVLQLKQTFSCTNPFSDTREKLEDAQKHGEKCAKSRIIELSEFLPCNVACQIPGTIFGTIFSLAQLYYKYKRIFWTVKLGLGDHGDHGLAPQHAEEGRKRGQGKGKSW